MALFDSILGVLQTGGGAIGAGGGLLAGELYRRFQGAKKDAKEALKIAKEAKALVENELKAGRAAATDAYQQGMTDARSYVDAALAKIARGSAVELRSDQETLERLAKLETRMSAIEDDLDQRDTEDKRWQQEIQRALGRIEGQLTNR